MALTIETLKKEPTLAELTPEQLTAITALSTADENTVIGTRVGEIHGAYEQDIQSITGISKNQGEKAYDYNKRVLGQYKTELEATKQAVEAIKTEKVNLEKKIAEGATDEVLKVQLEGLKTQLKDAQTAVSAKDKLIADTTNEYKNELLKTKVNFLFEQSNKDIKLKPVYSESISKTLLSQARNEILSKYNPDFITDANGNETLIFRDKTTNEIARNPGNSLNPYTIQDLYLTTVLKEAIDNGKKQNGGGTNNPSFSAGNSAMIDLAGVKTQKEADERIYSYLMQKGIARGTKEFSEQQTKIRNENDITKLPIR